MGQPPRGIVLEEEKTSTSHFIICDCLSDSFDSRRVQDELERYDGKMKISTPNLDKLSKRGAYFRNAYSHAPVTGPSQVRTNIVLSCSLSLF